MSQPERSAAALVDVKQDASVALASASTGTTDAAYPHSLQESPSLSKRRKDMFGDCALVEIIHLHDCLRGALRALERDVEDLNQTILNGDRNTSQLNELECRVNGRFKVIWSVFRAHSSAEDEFIWPALQLKTQGLVKGSPSYRPDTETDAAMSQTHQHQHRQTSSSNSSHSSTSSSPSQVVVINHGIDRPPSPLNINSVLVEDDGMMDQEAYEEDHADEERMFSDMDSLLTQLREALFQQQPATMSPAGTSNSFSNKSSSSSARKSVGEIMKSIHELTQTLSKHLMAHLEKEEKQCMPLVVKHLSKSEIHDLVGQIMGKRSSDMISEIMTMAVQNLNQADRLEMVKYMKQAMAGTFFDKWLSMSGWMEDVNSTATNGAASSNHTDDDRKRSNAAMTDDATDETNNKRFKAEYPTKIPDMSVPAATSESTATESRSDLLNDDEATSTAMFRNQAGAITSQAELEKLIRAIATNPTLTPQQKNTTIQGLRDSVWKSNQRLMAQSGGGVGGAMATTTATPISRTFAANETSSAAVSATCIPARRVTPPSMYYKMDADGKLEVAWDSDKPSDKKAELQVPLFSASELAPTYHDGATGAVLGCPHYARACKLRHPISGRLYTCRLCCEQEREMPSKDRDEPLDRYAVSEVMCMKCHSLQPAEDRCINPNCESGGKPFAKYFCKICHLYDDRSRPIFHCPYCNTCRMGLGLGIDFRHCMRCNACVSLDDHEHRCIPQKLQGSCPICHETLFQSTQPLRGLKCGHVMHMSCFTEYRRGQRYTCPLCVKSMEDMTDYFALLDAAVRMQPMPMAYLSTLSNVYCQDCEKTGQCRYHFVGQKCPHCGSYNTRELGRVQATEASVLT